MLDLQKLEQLLDEALERETPETLKDFLAKKRRNASWAEILYEFDTFGKVGKATPGCLTVISSGKVLPMPILEDRNSPRFEYTFAA